MVALGTDDGLFIHDGIVGVLYLNPVIERRPGYSEITTRTKSRQERRTRVEYFWYSKTLTQQRVLILRSNIANNF